MNHGRYLVVRVLPPNLKYHKEVLKVLFILSS